MADNRETHLIKAAKFVNFFNYERNFLLTLEFQNLKFSFKQLSLTECSQIP